MHDAARMPVAVAWKTSDRFISGLLSTLPILLGERVAQSPPDSQFRSSRKLRHGRHNVGAVLTTEAFAAFAAFCSTLLISGS
jgi:hypothetical protein